MKQINSILCIVIVAAVSTTSQNLYAQLETSIGWTPDEVAAALVGSGVTISDVTMNCDNVAFGKFNCVDCNVGIDSGIVLTSGQASVMEGPNNMGGAGFDNGNPGDPDLTALAGLSTKNACVLEFDVDVKFDSLIFQYVFGSEEYLEFVYGYNDIFAFFISGPGIVGEQNIALVPGTPTPVSIFNVNDVTNSEYYIDNGDGYSPPYSLDDYYIQYDGFTTVLDAIAVVQPCETYHLKLAVADAVDGILDSGVFIKAGSLTSHGVHLATTTSVGDGFDNAIEGCVDGDFLILADTPPTEDITFHLGIGGTATNGVDYPLIVDSVVLHAGEVSDTIFISPFADLLTEGLETVTIYLLNECDGLPYDSVTLKIQDAIDLTMDIEPDTTICAGDTVQLSVTGGLEYFWAPGFYVNTTFGDTIQAFPPDDYIYTVTTFLGSCTQTDTIEVNVSPYPPANAGGDPVICLGNSHTFYLEPGYTYAWDPPTFLDDATSNSPTALPDAVGITQYIVQVTDAFGCSSFDTVSLIVNSDPIVHAGPDTLVCPGDEVQLYANGGTYFQWIPATGISDATSSDPTVSTDTSITYSVVITDNAGCDDTIPVSISIEPFPIVDAGTLTVIFQGESTTLNGTSTGISNLWSPDETLTDPTILNPLAIPYESTWYYLTATSPIGCQADDSVHIVVVPKPAIEIPNAFSPNGDGLNDILHIITFQNVELTSFIIYNRWGQAIFETNSISQGWDGTFTGKEAEIGTYLYIFVGKDEKGQDLAQQGTINLLR